MTDQHKENVIIVSLIAVTVMFVAACVTTYQIFLVLHPPGSP